MLFRQSDSSIGQCAMCTNQYMYIAYHRNHLNIRDEKSKVYIKLVVNMHN
jgi:hypothetical protein